MLEWLKGGAREKTGEHVKEIAWQAGLELSGTPSPLLHWVWQGDVAGKWKPARGRGEWCRIQPKNLEQPLQALEPK